LGLAVCDRRRLYASFMCWPTTSVQRVNTLAYFIQFVKP